MKKRTLPAVLLVLLSALVFVSCQNTKNPETEKIRLAADGTALYTVTCSSNAPQKELEAAQRLCDTLHKMTGAEFTLRLAQPDDTAAPEKEILVGQTGSTESKELLETLSSATQFVIKMQGSKLVIGGSNANITSDAVSYFIANCLKYTEGTPQTPTLELAESPNIFIESENQYKIINISNGLLGNPPYMEQDFIRLVVCLQGKINADFENTRFVVHLNNDEKDAFWLKYMREDGNFYSDYQLNLVRTEKDFWDVFLPYIKQYGMVLWDPAVPATANVASTVCGVDGFLPVKYDTAENSLYTKLTELGVETKLSLVDKFTGEGTIPDTSVPSSGSTKCDAYLWALELYMDRCSTELLAYTLDGAGCVPGSTTYEGAESTSAFYNSIFNHDYFVMNRAFCFDLLCTEKDIPFDDPKQKKGTDYNTLCKILQAAYDRANGEFTRVVGFPPWWMKYTRFLNRGKTPEVTLEWAFAQLVTTYNCVLEADCAHPCCMTNASMYAYYPLEAKYENNRPTQKLTFDKKTRYFTVYVGDYDSSAWLKYVIPDFYTDSARGSIPLAWGFNPNLSKRIPMVFDYVYKNKTENDYFVTGDSGAGYINPGALFQGNGGRTLPSAGDAWVKYNEPFLKQFDMDICGFILNGALRFDRDVYNLYNQITPTGAFSNNSMRLVTFRGTPITGMRDYTNKEEFYDYMQDRVNFSVCRTIRVSPTQIEKTVNDILAYANGKNDGYTYCYVDPYTFFDLIVQSGQGRAIR